MTGELNLPDLQWLAARVPALRRLGGALEASVTVSGTPAELVLSGVAKISKGEFRLASELPPCRDITAEVALEDEQTFLRRIRSFFSLS